MTVQSSVAMFEADSKRRREPLPPKVRRWCPNGGDTPMRSVEANPLRGESQCDTPQSYVSPPLAAAPLPRKKSNASMLSNQGASAGPSPPPGGNFTSPLPGRGSIPLPGLSGRRDVHSQRDPDQSPLPPFNALRSMFETTAAPPIRGGRKWLDPGPLPIRDYTPPVRTQRAVWAHFETAQASSSESLQPAKQVRASFQQLPRVVSMLRVVWEQREAVERTVLPRKAPPPPAMRPLRDADVQGEPVRAKTCASAEAVSAEAVSVRAAAAPAKPIFAAPDQAAVPVRAALTSAAPAPAAPAPAPAPPAPAPAPPARAPRPTAAPTAAAPAPAPLVLNGLLQREAGAGTKAAVTPIEAPIKAPIKAFKGATYSIWPNVSKEIRGEIKKREVVHMWSDDGITWHRSKGIGEVSPVTTVRGAADPPSSFLEKIGNFFKGTADLSRKLTDETLTESQQTRLPFGGTPAPPEQQATPPEPTPKEERSGLLGGLVNWLEKLMPELALPEPDAAATRLQAQCRGSQSRASTKGICLSKCDERAAVCIQASVRGNSARNGLGALLVEALARHHSDAVLQPARRVAIDRKQTPERAAETARIGGGALLQPQAARAATQVQSISSAQLAQRALHEDSVDAYEDSVDAYGAFHWWQQREAAAATQVQSACRGQQTRTALQAQQLQRDEEGACLKAASATQVQGGYRGQQTRAAIQEQQLQQLQRYDEAFSSYSQAAAATRVQSTYHGQQTRAALRAQQVQGYDEAFSSYSQAAAATRVQSTYRGQQTRAALRAQQVQGYDEAFSSYSQAAAATRVQSTCRGQQTSAALQAQQVQGYDEDAYLMAAAATQVQSVYRGQQTRAALQEQQLGAYEPDVSAAATQVQSVVRGQQTRASLQAQQLETYDEDVPSYSEAAAATQVQSVVRGQQTRAALQAQQVQGYDKDVSSYSQAKAATRVQSTYRGHQTRAALQEQQLQRSEEDAYLKAAAATQVQSVYRGQQARTALQEQQLPRFDEAISSYPEAAAATQVQSVYRGHQTRAALQERQLEAHEQDVSAAATRVQSVYRGQQTRALQEQQVQAGYYDLSHAEAAAAMQVQSLERGSSSRTALQEEQLRRYEEEASSRRCEEGGALHSDAAAATQIQSMYRGKQTRAALQEQQLSAFDGDGALHSDAAAATQIQSMYRGQKVRAPMVQQRREDDAAVKLQAAGRGRHVRRQNTAVDITPRFNEDRSYGSNVTPRREDAFELGPPTLSAFNPGLGAAHRAGEATTAAAAEGAEAVAPEVTPEEATVPDADPEQAGESEVAQPPVAAPVRVALREPDAPLLGSELLPNTGIRVAIRDEDTAPDTARPKGSARSARSTQSLPSARDALPDAEDPRLNTQLSWLMQQEGEIDVFTATQLNGEPFEEYSESFSWQPPPPRSEPGFCRKKTWSFFYARVLTLTKMNATELRLALSDVDEGRIAAAQVKNERRLEIAMTVELDDKKTEIILVRLNTRVGFSHFCSDLADLLNYRGGYGSSQPQPKVQGTQSRRSSTPGHKVITLAKLSQDRSRSLSKALGLPLSDDAETAIVGDDSRSDCAEGDQNEEGEALPPAPRDAAPRDASPYMRASAEQNKEDDSLEAAAAATRLRGSADSGGSGSRPSRGLVCVEGGKVDGFHFRDELTLGGSQAYLGGGLFKPRGNKLFAVGVYADAVAAEETLLPFLGMSAKRLSGNDRFFAALCAGPFVKSLVWQFCRSVSVSSLVSSLQQVLGRVLNPADSKAFLDALKGLFGEEVPKGETVYVVCDGDNVMLGVTSPEVATSLTQPHLGTTLCKVFFGPGVSWSPSCKSGIAQGVNRWSYCDVK